MPVQWFKFRIMLQPPTTVPVVLFENNDAYRNSLEWFFAEFPGIQLAGAYADGTDPVAKMESGRVKVVLMDIDMPQENGISATAKIKAAYPETAVLIVTVFDENEKVFEAIKAGADGYLLKSTPPHEMVKAIYDAANGGSPMTPSIARKVLQLFAHPAASKPATQQVSLTEKEKSVLQQLVNGHSYKMIANDLQISVDTVRFHIRNIYAKLHVNSATEAVSLAIKNRLV